MPVTQCLVSTAGAILVTASWRARRVHPRCALLVALAVALLGSACAVAAEVTARFSLEQPGAGPFPSNLFTIADPRQYTGRRVHLPLPPCEAHPSDCDDLDLINTLDGFNLQPRLSIPFSGPIAVETVTSTTVFLLRLASTRDTSGHSDAGRVAERLIGINQVVWDPQTSTLHVESDALLGQHTLYALIVTRGVRDLEGAPVRAASTFTRFLFAPAAVDVDADVRAYRDLLLHAMVQADFEGVVRPRDIAVMSVFTTQSATVTLESIRDQIKAAPPTPATFLPGSGTTRTVFALAEVTNITWRQQVGADASDPAAFEQQRVRIDLLSLVPNAVHTIAFGAYRAPNYQIAAGIIPPPGIGVGGPVVQGHHEVFFTLFLPAGQRPTSGWPVAIVGPGRGASKNSSTSYSIAATIAARGIATIIINAVGHGFGPLGSLTVSRTAGDPVTFPAGGRGIDQDGDGRIQAFEGLFTDLLRFERDSLQQTVADLMQLVRVIEGGMDVDGDGSGDLDPARISYIGVSLGANYGIMLVAVDPAVRAGVFNVPGGPLVETLRLSGAGNRRFIERLLATRTPPLTNVGDLRVEDFRFEENMPLRHQPPVINEVSGAMAIQEVLDRREWLSQVANPVAYAPHLRKMLLAGVPAKSVLIQLARGDRNFPNPTTTAILRAGALADRATCYRHDLALQEPHRTASGAQIPENPHVFMLRITSPAVQDIALAAQRQMAEFLATDGAVVIDPDGQEGALFEVPMGLPLPEDLGFRR